MIVPYCVGNYVFICSSRVGSGAGSWSANSLLEENTHYRYPMFMCWEFKRCGIPPPSFRSPARKFVLPAPWGGREEGVWPDHTKVKSRTDISTESKDSCSAHLYQKAVLRIRDILVRIRILGSGLFIKGSGCGSGRPKNIRIPNTGTFTSFFSLKIKNL